MEVRKQIWLWYVGCGLACLSALSIPFAWRTEASMILMCGFPCIGLLGLICLTIFLAKTQIGTMHTLIGIFCFPVCLYFGFNSDELAREWMFRLNFSSYQSFVSRVIQDPTKRVGEHAYDQGTIPGMGVYDGDVDYQKDRIILRIHTICGPTLETVVYSQKPLEGEKYTFKRRDKLGYWYFYDY